MYSNPDDTRVSSHDYAYEWANGNTHTRAIIRRPLCYGTQWRIQESDDVYAHFRDNE